MDERVIKAFLGGAVAGVVLGLLFAPREGRETRENIREFFEKEKEKLGDMINSVRDTVCGEEEPVAEKIAAAKVAVKSVKEKVARKRKTEK